MNYIPSNSTVVVINKSMSLTDFCLNSITNNFSRFNFLFSTTEDYYTKKLLEFLQRRYSGEMLSRLCEKDSLTEEFVDILVNKHIKHLNSSWFRSCSLKKTATKIAEIGRNIKSLVIEDDDFDIQLRRRSYWQDGIRHLPNLRSFTCRRKLDSRTGSILKNVAQCCRSIEEIDVEYSSVFEDVEYLCKDSKGRPLCQNLKKLRIGSNLILDSDADYLIENLPSLEDFDYDRLASLLVRKNIKEVPSSPNKVKTYNFTHLFIPFKFKENDLKICMAACPNLKYLNCNAICYENQLDYLASHLPNELKQLRLFCSSNFREEDNGVTQFLESIKSRKLSSLELINCSASNSVFANSFPHLRELKLFGVRIISEDYSTLNSFSQLTLGNDYFYEEKDLNYTLVLSQSKRLKSLELHATDLSSPEFRECLLECCRQNPIERLLFKLLHIEKDFFKRLLTSCDSLKFLTILGSLNDSEEDELLHFLKTMPSKPKVEYNRANFYY